MEVENRYDFIPLDFVQGSWVLKQDSLQIASGELPPLSAGPGERQVFKIPLVRQDIIPGAEYWLNLSFRLRASQPWADRDYEVAWEQFKMPWTEEPLPVALNDFPSLELTEKEGRIVLQGRDFILEFDERTGSLNSFKYREIELLESGPEPYFWRAPVDNDRGNGMPKRCAVWRDAGPDRRIISVETTTLSPQAVRITVKSLLAANDSPYTTVYTVLGSGDILVEGHFTPQGELPELPRFGMRMSLLGEFDRISWYGRGPHETYWDRKTGARVGLYRGTVKDQFFDYSRPQENGNKTDVRWVSLTNRDGLGLLAVGRPLVSVSAHCFTPEEMERAEHSFELQPSPFITLLVDEKQMGVGGDNSWGARPHDWCTLFPQAYSYSFLLKPFKSSEDDPTTLSRRKIAVPEAGDSQ
jgi:beta-galactosidase